MDSAATDRQFRKNLNLFDSTAIVVGSMIGSGIFIVTTDMSLVLGAPGWVLLAWLITGLMTIIAAVSYGELAAMMPNAGGQYVYIREAYNPLTAFLYGWTLFLVIQGGSIAAIAMAFGKFTGVIFPWFSEGHVLADFGIIKINSVHLIAILSIAFLSYINSKGIRIGKIVQNAFTYSKTLALGIFILAGIFFLKNTEVIRLNTDIFWEATTNVEGLEGPVSGFSLLIVLGVSLVGALFTYDAWYNITFTGAEVINPKRNIPMGLFLGTLLVTIIYLLVNIVYIIALPMRGNPEGTTVLEQGIQYATDSRLGTAAMQGLLGDRAALVMAILVMVSTFGANNGIILSGARVYYAMAKDNLFYKQVGILNRFNVPGKGLLVQCVWACLLCLSGTYNNLLDYVVFSVLIFYSLTVLAVMVMRIRKPHIERPYKAFGYPGLQILYLVAAVFIMLVLLIYKPDYTWPGLIIVFLGVPVYYGRRVWQRRMGKNYTNEL